MHVGITGGSASAIKQCHPGGWFNVFDRHLRNAFPVQSKDLVSHNAAQGTTNSMWSSMMLDSLFDTLDLDVIVWEYAINDAAFNTKDRMSLYLDIWLKRVSQLPSHPAVVLLYLWDSTRPDDTTKLHPDQNFPISSAYEAQLPVVKHYLEMGMDISVVNVAAGLNQNGRSILVDKHHPNCKGEHYIGDVLASYFLRQASQALKRNGFQPDCSKWAENIKPFHHSTHRDLAIETMMSSRAVLSSHEFSPKQGRQPRVWRSKRKTVPMHGTNSSMSREGKP